jgi:hypothetical protein
MGSRGRRQPEVRMVAVLDCQVCHALTSSARFRYVCERLVCDSCGAENPQARVRSIQARDIFVHFTAGVSCSVQAMDLNLDRVLGPRVAVTSRRHCAVCSATLAPTVKRCANTISPTRATAKAAYASRSSPAARICCG